MADILSFENHELLKAKFVSAVMKTPFTGLQQFSVEQVMEADVQFWLLMAEATRDGIRRQGAKDRPCDEAFKEVFKHPDFTIAMTPRQIGSGSASRASRPPPQAPSSSFAAGASSVSKNHLKKQKQVAKLNAAFSSPAQSPSKGNSSKGNSKGGKAVQVRLPPGLHGMCPRSSQATGNKRTCFAFNLGQCNATSPGQECAKGVHLCVKPSAGGEACSKPHGANSCTGA